MDGNQRWAKKNNLSLKDGYFSGFNKLNEIIKFCISNNINDLTTYAMSAENMKRNSSKLIFNLIFEQYFNFVDSINKENNIKINLIGDIESLPKKIKKIFKELINKTKNNLDLNLNIVFNYSVDYELIQIIKSINNLSKPRKKIDINMIKSFMYLDKSDDPDLLIRTGGFKRLSNFIPLNLRYTELFFSDTLWPEFTILELKEIINNFSKIKRNYGL